MYVFGDAIIFFFFVISLHSAIGDDLERRFWERTFASI